MGEIHDFGADSGPCADINLIQYVMILGSYFGSYMTVLTY